MVFLAAVAMTMPAAAADRITVRLGMSMTEIEPYLRENCAELIIGGDAEKYITCELKSGSLITANVSPKGRITYSVYREPGDPGSVAVFAAETARELGYQGEGQDCMVYSDPSLCWQKGTAKFWVYKAPDAQGRMATFQSDEAMAAEDG